MISLTLLLLAFIDVLSLGVFQWCHILLYPQKSLQVSLHSIVELSTDMSVTSSASDGNSNKGPDIVLSPFLIRRMKICLRHFSKCKQCCSILCYWWMFAFVVLDLVSLVTNQEIGCEERLQSGVSCFKWDMKALILN